MKNKIMLSIVIIISLLLLFINYIKTPRSQLINYYNFHNELNNDMNRYGIDPENQEDIKNVVKKIIKEKSKEKTLDDYLDTCKSGLVRGCVLGYLLGDNGLYSSFTSGGTYALVNPILMYIGF